MKTRRTFLAAACFGLLSFSHSSRAAETIEDYRPLLDNSPFLTQAFKNRLANSDATGINHYIFVGYTQIGKNWKLCLINKKTNLATWVEVDGTLEGYILKAFHPKKQTIDFEKDGITATMELEQPK